MLCNICKTDKPEPDFFPSVKRKCKDCFNAYAREWYKRFPEKAKAIAAQKRETYRERIRVSSKRYYDTHGKKRSPNYIEVNKCWVAAHKKERNASARLRYAIRSGRVLRPGRCDACNTNCTPHGHHFDYNRALEVIWLCASCHRDNHSHHPRPIKAKVLELVKAKFPTLPTDAGAFRA